MFTVHVNLIEGRSGIAQHGGNPVAHLAPFWILPGWCIGIRQGDREIVRVNSSIRTCNAYGGSFLGV
jgi:hypothetical protein